MASVVSRSVCLFVSLILAAAFDNVGCTCMSRTTSPEETLEGASRHTVDSRALLAAHSEAADDEVVKTVFDNGWASGCSWVASGASNISIIAGAGVNKSSGLCTTFPKAGGWMSFQCSGSDNLTTALHRSSGVDFYISQLTNDQIGSGSATTPKGLQLIVQDKNSHFTCRRPLGSGDDHNNGLVEISIPFKGSIRNPTGNNQDCRPALQNATAIGFVSSYDGIAFCLDGIQLV